MQTDCKNTRERADTEHLNAHARLFEALTACEFRVLFSIGAGAVTARALAALEAEGLLWDCVGSKLSLNPAGGTCENIALLRGKMAFCSRAILGALFLTNASWEQPRRRSH